MSGIEFFIDSRGFVQYNIDDDRLIPLAVWFKMELRNSPYQCLDLLMLIDDVASGREESTLWEGEAFEVTFTKAGVHVVNTVLEEQNATYPLAEVTVDAEDYWRWLEGNPRMEEDIIDWEQTWERVHPYRGRLF